MNIGAGRKEVKAGLDFLMWLSYLERPLNANELFDALRVEIGSTNLNSENIPTIETLENMWYYCTCLL